MASNCYAYLLILEDYVECFAEYRFLRKIETVIPQYTSIDEVIEKHQNNKADVPNRDMEIPSVGDEGIDYAEEENRQVEVIEPRRSNREIKPPERFQSKW